MVTDSLDSLMERVSAGDRRAYEAFYDRMSPRIFGLLRRMMNSPEFCEEICQETFLEVWRRRGEFDSTRASAWGWVALLARSRAIDRLRATRSYSSALLKARREVDMPWIGAAHSAPHSHVIDPLLAGRLNRAVTRLPEGQRQAVELAFFRGLTHREVARAMGTPLGTIKTRIRQGLATLRLELAGPRTASSRRAAGGRG